MRGDGGRWVRPGPLLVLIMVLLAACSWNSQEPGLFGNNRPSTPPSSGSSPARQPDRINPDLPVLGERTVMPGGPDDPPFRVAVHAIRRIDGGTLLDWSVTPLQIVGRHQGQLLESNTTATQFGHGEGFRLLDVDHHKIYQPLIRRHDGCLCSIALEGLRIGETSLFQVVFPSLLTSVHTVTVDIPDLELFTDVPVPDRGTYFAPTHPVDLARSPDVDDVIRWSPDFSYAPAGGQKFRIGVISVVAGSAATSVVWSIWSITDGDGLVHGGRPPITSRRDQLADRSTASGLELEVPGGMPIGTWYEHTGPPRTDTACLCSDLTGTVTDMARARRSVTVVTAMPPLPLRTQFVDVVLPGVGRMKRIPVTEATDAGSQVSGQIPDPSEVVDHKPGQWWSQPIESWPTSRPAPAMLKGAHAVIAHLT